MWLNSQICTFKPATEGFIQACLCFRGPREFFFSENNRCRLLIAARAFKLLNIKGCLCFPLCDMLPKEELAVFTQKTLETDTAFHSVSHFHREVQLKTTVNMATLHERIRNFHVTIILSHIFVIQNSIPET